MGSDIGPFIGAVLWNYWTLFTSIALVAEPVIRSLWRGYDNWAKFFITESRRRQFSKTIALLTFVCANFLAYHSVRDEWRAARGFGHNENSSYVQTREITEGSSYNVAKSDYIILVNKPNYSKTSIILPKFPLEGRRIEIKSAGKAGPITIYGNGNAIDGGKYYVLSVPQAAITVTFIDSEWRIT